MSKREPNWIALGCGIVFILCYLFLPFYHVILLPVNGMLLIQYINIVMVLPLLAGVMMGLASLLLHPKISIGIGVGTLAMVFLLLLLGSTILTSGNGLAGLATALVGGQLLSMASSLFVQVGIGAIACLVLCIAFIAAEIWMNSQKPAKIEPIDDFFR